MTRGHTSGHGEPATDRHAANLARVERLRGLVAGRRRRGVEAP